MPSVVARALAGLLLAVLAGGCAAAPPSAHQAVPVASGSAARHGGVRTPPAGVPGTGAPSPTVPATAPGPVGASTAVGSQGAPGTVVRADPLVAPDGVRAWTVSYLSTAQDGSLQTVSGVVAAPGNRSAPLRGVVGLGHPTTGIADACAPSRGGLSSGSLLDIIELARVGYAVAATDYPGLGTPGEHPYLVGRSEGVAVLDAVRAARTLTGAPGGLALLGFSQGGQAVLWADRLARDYAPELHVVGVAALAPVTDVEALLAATVRPYGASGWPMVTLLLAASWSELYDAPTDRLLTPAGRQLARALLSACPGHVRAAAPRGSYLRLGAQLPRELETMLGDDALGARRGSGAPVLVVQAADDTAVPYQITTQAVTRMCAAGDDVDLRRLRRGGHLASTSEPVLAATRAWIADRFAGVRLPAGCRRHTWTPAPVATPGAS